MRRQKRLVRFLSSSRLLALAAIVVVPMQPASSGAEAAAPRTNDEKMLYQWGAAIADELDNVGVAEPKEQEWIFRGMSDRVAGRSPAFTADERSRLTSYLLGRIEKNGVYQQKLALVYLQQRAKEPNAVVAKSGVIYREIVKGNGAQPAGDSPVKVGYVGMLRNGWVFDSSRQRGIPLETSLSTVIPCWQEAIPMMKVGGKAVITCPPKLGYGDAGSYNIPPGSALTFEVELLGVGK